MITYSLRKLFRKTTKSEQNKIVGLDLFLNDREKHFLWMKNAFFPLNFPKALYTQFVHVLRIGNFNTLLCVHSIS